MTDDPLGDEFRTRLETEQSPLNRYRLLGWHPLPFGGSGRRQAAKRILIILIIGCVTAAVLTLIADLIATAFAG